MVDPEFHDSVLAEIAVLNMAVMKALSGLAALSGDPEQYKKQLLEAGLRDFSKTNYGTVPEERRQDFIDQLEARYSDLIAGVLIRG